MAPPLPAVGVPAVPLTPPLLEPPSGARGRGCGSNVKSPPAPTGAVPPFVEALPALPAATSDLPPVLVPPVLVPPVLVPPSVVSRSSGVVLKALPPHANVESVTVPRAMARPNSGPDVRAETLIAPGQHDERARCAKYFSPLR
jgi:hypothetical protein